MLNKLCRKNAGYAAVHMLVNGDSKIAAEILKRLIRRFFDNRPCVKPKLLAFFIVLNHLVGNFTAFKRILLKKKLHAGFRVAEPSASI